MDIFVYLTSERTIGVGIIFLMSKHSVKSGTSCFWCVILLAWLHTEMGISSSLGEFSVWCFYFNIKETVIALWEPKHVPIQVIIHLLYRSLSFDWWWSQDIYIQSFFSIFHYLSYPFSHTLTVHLFCSQDSHSYWV